MGRVSGASRRDDFRPRASRHHVDICVGLGVVMLEGGSVQIASMGSIQRTGESRLNEKPMMTSAAICSTLEHPNPDRYASQRIFVVRCVRNS